MIISFSGVDGSGKTTHALFVRRFMKENKQKVVYIHMIQWTLVNRLGRFIGRFNKEQNEDQSRKKERKQYKLVILIVSVIDVIRFYLKYFLICKVRGHIIICDRYFYDLGVQGIYTGIMDKNFELFYWWLVPHPQVAFLLDVPPEKASMREGEHNLSYYKIKRKMYLDRLGMWDIRIIREGSLVCNQQIIKKTLTSFMEKSFV